MANGDKYWYLDNVNYSESDFNIEINKRKEIIMIEYEVIVENGDKYWYLNGKRHREDGPAIEMANGNKYWYRNGKLHREDGPAAEYANGTKEWYIDGKLHREDGPASEYATGNKLWYLNDINYLESDFNLKMNNRKELTIAEIEKLLGYSIIVIK
jgi:hypothetical protein